MWIVLSLYGFLWLVQTARADGMNISVSDTSTDYKMNTVNEDDYNTYEEVRLTILK